MILFTGDETPVRCNDPDEKHGGTTEGWLWVINRPGTDLVFDRRLSRRHAELMPLKIGYTMASNLTSAERLPRNRETVKSFG